MCSSEEYEPDARTFDADANKDKDISDRKIFGRSNSRSIPPFMRYFGMYTTKVTPTEARAKGFFPYMYGYIWETKINMGKESTAKHFTLGRRANELGYVM